MNLTGKSAIVTGAARGLGRAYAHKMVVMGVNVVAADIADCGETVAGAYGPGKIVGTRVDVASFDSAEAMAALACERFGGIDILVNNAALYGSLRGGRIEAIDEADWDACMAVNVKGQWLCAKAVIRRCASAAVAASSTSRRWRRSTACPMRCIILHRKAQSSA